MRIAFVKCHGSGNDFPLIDARAMTLADEQWAALARLMADRDGPVGGDGLLLLGQPVDNAYDFSMRMFNSDGSEAETCLNGLRCVSRLGFELLGVERARVSLKQSVAEVERRPEIAPGVVTVATRAGASTRTAEVGLRIDAAEIVDTPIPGLPSDRAFTAVAMPNPHLIAFVDRVDEAELVALGSWCESAPAMLPGRGNVSFVEMREGGLFVRTFERGVGLTESCGSAMAASTYAAGLTGRVPFGTEILVFNKGGMVRAEARAPDQGGDVTVAGNASFLYDASVEVDLEAGRIAPPLVHARREDEWSAWEAAVAALN